METKSMEQNREEGSSNVFEKFTPEFSEVLNQLIRSAVGGIIGIALTILFGTVVVAVIIVSVFIDRSNAPHLLSNALTLVGSALGAVLGYFLGRTSKGK
jgi:uncharacterized membrane protein AbrB (regulator of aidB expression)